MPALCGSDIFIELPGERRSELFDQFSILRSVLIMLDKYVSKDPSQVNTERLIAEKN